MKRLLAIVVGIASTAAIIGFAALNVANGILLCLFLAVWVLVPSAPLLSRRLALNGALAIGLLPILWWAPWPVVASAGHAAFAVGLLVGLVVVLALWSPATRRSLLPTVARNDVLLLVVGAIMAYLYLPFVLYRSGPSALNMLMRAFGGDNVAHFDMFEMIRHTQVMGTWWGEASDGSLFAYVPYPQHFHSLAVFGAELWSGAVVQPTDVEAALFGIGSAFAIVITVLSLVAGILALPQFAARFWLAAVSVTAVLSLFVLGLGAEVLGYGFPGYLVSAAGAALSLVLATGTRGRSPRLIDLVAIVATAILVAHTWVLLAPVALVAVLFVVLGLPFRSYLHRWQAAVPVVVVLLLGAVAVVFAGVLALVATSSVSSPERALATSGAVPRSDLPLIATIVLATVGVAFLLIRRDQEDDRSSRRFGALLISSATVAVIVGVGLIAVQVKEVGALDYFQFKYINAVFLIFGVMLALAISTAVASMPTSEARGIGRALNGAAALSFAIAIVTLSGIIAPTVSAFTEWRLPALTFRNSLVSSALTPPASVGDLVVASNAMAVSNCDRPIYLAKNHADFGSYFANQWAMSLSSKWSEGSSEITSYLFKSNDASLREDPLDVSLQITTLLGGHPERCLLTTPQLLNAVDAAVIDRFDDQIEILKVG